MNDPMMKCPTYARLGTSLLLCLPLMACRKQTPVNEVSIQTSGVDVVDQDLSTLSNQWHQWRGPSGDGIAKGQDIPTQWADEENIRYVVDIPGRGHGSPILIVNLVVLGTALQEQQKQMLIAYDQQSGKKKWEAVIHEGGFPGSRDVHQKASNANGTPASDGEVIITAHLNQERIYVTAVDLLGQRKWQTEIGAFDSKFGYAPSPILYKSLVIVAADNFGGGYLVGLDRASGEIAWRTKRGDASTYSSPHLASIEGVDQILVSGGDRLASYSPDTGEVRWETPCLSEATCGTVVTSKNRIFASGGYPDKETVALSGNGTRLWSNRTKIYEPSMVTNGDLLFAVSDNGIAYCWDAENGDERWKKRLGGNFSSSPVLCSGKLFVADLQGNCYIFEANPDAFELVSKNRLGDDCYASPAVDKGAIYFRIGKGDERDRREKLICIASGSTGGVGQAVD